MLLKSRRTPITRDNGGFIARPNMPGWMLRRPVDHGHGPLAMVVESILHPGRLIALHEHRNDEIISWVPDGVMRHEDSVGGRLVIDAGHLMVMNAGQSIWHSEETTPTDPHLRMLQTLLRTPAPDLDVPGQAEQPVGPPEPADRVAPAAAIEPVAARVADQAVRPRAADLEPLIQFKAIHAAPPNTWRHLVGPEGGPAPFFVRSALDFHDIRLHTGAAGDFPAIAGRDLYFYVFSGAIMAGGKRFAQA